MKKLGITLLAAAFSLPLTFAATQAAQSTPSNGQAQTETAKPAKKHKKSVRRHRGKKSPKTGTSNSATPTPATK
jgi:hypothetical protein